MTTKELLRRLSVFSSLDLAAYYFSDPVNDFVFRVVCDGVTRYTLSYFLELPDSLQYASVQRFSRSAFLIQVKYFKAFYNRASQTQKDYILRSLLVSNLVKYLDDSSIK